MKEYGEFDVPDNTQVKYEFPCPKCGELVTGTFNIATDQHKDETAVCSCCDSNIDIIIMHDAGTGTVNVPALKDKQKTVKAEGIR